MLATRAFGLEFRNPIGLAAGFDKDAVAVVPLMRLGFGFVEAGTVTPRPQPGNPRPRLFRLRGGPRGDQPHGLQQCGARRLTSRGIARPAAAAARRARRQYRRSTRKARRRERDYPALYAAVAPLADYVTVNVSSPNTPGLRDLQGEERLAAILAAMAATRAALHAHAAAAGEDRARPAPTTRWRRSSRPALTRGVAGLIVSNTTIARPGAALRAREAQAGGLSGAPLLRPLHRRAAQRVARSRAGAG